MARRVSILGALMVGILWLASTPALAKGQEVRESVTISVSGPSLSKPVQLHWKGRCPLGFFPCPQSLSDFSVAMSDIGMLSARGAAYGPPPASKLGPKYDMTVTFDLKDGPTYVVHKDLYPFGPGTSALHVQPCPAQRRAAAARAASTRARTVAVSSAGSPTADSAVTGYIRARR